MSSQRPAAGPAADPRPHPVRRASRAVVASLRACHPIPTVAVSVMAALLAAGAGLSVGRTILFSAAVLTGQLSIGWSNDALDAGRDRASGRTDKPAATDDVSTRTLVIGAAVAVVVTVVLSLLLGLAPGLTALVLVASGWAYNVGLKATAFSPLPYLLGFGALPAAAFLAAHADRAPLWWVPATGALLGLGAHVANVLPDLDTDAATGVRGLPHRLGAGRSLLLMTATLVAASVVLALVPDGRALWWRVGLVAVGVLVAGAAAALAPHRPTIGFRVVVLLAVFDVVAFVFAVR